MPGSIFRMEQQYLNKNNNPNRFSNYVNKNTIKNVFFFTGGIVLFIAGVIGYGIILNLRAEPISELMAEKGIAKFTTPKIGILIIII